MGPQTCPLAAVETPSIEFFMQSAHRIGLTDEQQGKLMEMFGKKMQTNKPLMDKATKATKDLRAAVLAPDFDAKKVQELAAESAKAEAVLIQEAVQTWKGIRAILTTEQMKAVTEMMKRPPMMGPGMMGPGGMPGMGMGPGAMPGGPGQPGGKGQGERNQRGGGQGANRNNGGGQGQQPGGQGNGGYGY